MVPDWFCQSDRKAVVHLTFCMQNALAVNNKESVLLTGGFLIGMAFGIGTRYVLRWMRHLGAGIEQQVALTFALGYLVFYTANGPAAVSGARQMLDKRAVKHDTCHEQPMYDVHSRRHRDM